MGTAKMASSCQLFAPGTNLEQAFTADVSVGGGQVDKAVMFSREGHRFEPSHRRSNHPLVAHC